MSFLTSLNQLTSAGSWSLLVLVCVIMVTYHWFKNRRLPPGPYGLPYVGYGPFLPESRAKMLGQLCKKYNTDILSINIYGRLIVYLNTHDIIKEAFQKRTDLTGRLWDASFSRLDPGYGGIIGSQGKFWRDHRRFAISMLRDFGMGRITAEKNIQDEIEHVNDVFRDQNGRAFNPQHWINMAVSNVICTIAFGERFNYDDESFQSALDGMNKMMGQFSKQDHLSHIFRMILGNLPEAAVKTLFGWRLQAIINCFEGFAKFVKGKVEEHRKLYDGTVNDLIDGYFNEMEKQANDPESEFNDRQAACLITDLFIAGSETTYTTLRWAVVYMAAYPDIQEKVHQELNEVIGADRLPQMADKKLTPYTEAVLSEVQRFNTLLQLGVAHANVSEDVEINGYIIPKSTPVVPNFYHVHRDPIVWKHPDNFDPENFLDDDGKVINLEKLIPFSIGRRACAGEALARMELYIFFASWLKDFLIKPAEEGKVPDLKGLISAVFMPAPFEVRIIERYPKRSIPNFKKRVLATTEPQ